MNFEDYKKELFNKRPKVKEEYEKIIEIVKFIENEFGFKEELIDFDEIDNLNHFTFKVGKYIYQADIQKDKSYILKNIIA